MGVNFGDLFSLQEEFVRGAVRATPVGDVVREDEIAIATGRSKPETPMCFEQYEGVELCDLVGTQYAALRLVSHRVCDAFREARLSGWDTLAVELRDRTGETIDGYLLLVIVGRCGPLDNTRSVRINKIMTRNRKGYAPVWKGLYFDEDTWDGSDLFAPQGTAFFFATRQVKDVLEKISATNFQIKPLKDIERVSLI
jgi:hypothetical protein